MAQILQLARAAMTEGESIPERIVRVEEAIKAIRIDMDKIVHAVAGRDAQHAENSRRLGAIEQLLAGDRVRRDLISRTAEWVVRIVIAVGTATAGYFIRDWTGHH